MLPQSFSLENSYKIKPFNKSIKVDSDKSLSIRSLLFGAICEGISKTKNILESHDVLDTIKVLRKLGVKIKKDGPKSYLVYGKALSKFLWFF